MITVSNLTKKYAGNTVLDIEHLEIPRGQSFGLVGNNGAGKTTFFSLLLDLLQLDTGCIFNSDITVDQSEEWKTFTGSFIDESFLIGHLTPEEYFYFIGSLRQQDKSEVDELLARFKEFFNGEILGKRKYIRDLSKGNRKKTGIVAALIGNPRVVILDEPFANLDPTTQIRLKRIIKELTSQREITFLISSHDLIHVTEVCQRIVVLDRGTPVKDLHTSTATLRELENYFSEEQPVNTSPGF